MGLGRRARLALAISLSIGLGLLGYSLHTGQLQRWIRDRAVRAFVQKIQPHLPFKVDKVELEADWRSLLMGKASQLRLWLSQGPFRVEMRGALHLERSSEKGDMGVLYKPSSIFFFDEQAADPLNLEILVTLDSAFTQLSRLRIATHVVNWKWPVFDLESDGLTVDLSWEKGQLAGLLSWKALTWERSESQALSMAHLNFQLATPFDLSRLALGPQLDISWSASAAEFLLGEDYYDIPLRRVPGRLKWQGLADIHAQKLDFESLRVEVGDPGLELNLAQLTGDQERSRFRLDWNLKALPLKEWAADLPKALAQDSSSGIWAALKIEKGDLKSRGTLDLLLPARDLRLKSLGKVDWLNVISQSTFDGSLELDNVSVVLPQTQLRVQGLHLKIPFQQNQRKHGGLGSKVLQFKNFKGELTSLPLDTRVSLKGDWNLALGLPQGISPQLGDLKFVLGATQAQLQYKVQDQQKLHFQTALHVPQASLRDLAKGLCLEPSSFPPGDITIDFPHLTYAGGDWRAPGGLRFQLFGGALELSNFKFKNIFSQDYEVHLDAQWDGIQLNDLEQWIPFGEVDGVLQGYARNVVIRQGFPVNYDFLIQVKPNRKADVVFSPEAMRNFIRLVSGERIDEKIPGFVRWFVFGWPRRVTGGYDVEYVGIRLRSQKGVIVLESLDPPQVVDEAGEHYILKGSGLFPFNMPIKSKTYPVLLDAPAMAHFVRHLKDVIGGLKSNKEKTHEDPKTPACFEYP